MSKLRVLMYHKVSENETDFLTVTTHQLREQLQWLKSHYHFITLRDLTGHLSLGKKLPENALLITFDDGYANNYSLAYPVFKALNIPFCIFLVGDFIGKTLEYDGQMQQFLNTSELQDMQDLVQYGYHSASHSNLMDLPENKRLEEIRQGMDSLKPIAIKIEKAWAYTYGSFPKKNAMEFNRLMADFKSCGIGCAFRIGNRINTIPVRLPYAIQRIDIRGNEGFARFKWKVRFGKLF